MTANQMKAWARNIFWFVSLSLLAVVLVETNALLGLAGALIGGVLFGILLFVK